MADSRSDATTEINKLGLATRADTPEELAKLLEAHGVIPVAWSRHALLHRGLGSSPSAD
jgi:hypothetical protein